MNPRKLFYLFIILSVIGSCPSPLFADVDANRLEKLSKGISLSHWYWMPSSGSSPAFTEASTGGQDAYITDADIVSLKHLGFKHVRIPFDMDRIDASRMNHLHKDINRFLAQDIAVIVSAFGKEYNHQLMVSGIAHTKLLKLCEALRDLPSTHVFLQVANEPGVEDPDQWSQTQAQLIRKARKVLPDHTLITSTPLKYGKGTSDWGMIQAFSRMIPSNDDNVVYALHFYEPFFFTHQGAEWDANAKFVKNVTYPTGGDLVILNPEAPAWVKETLEQVWDKQKLKDAIHSILEWRTRHYRPVMITEFGVYKPYVQPTSRYQWVADVASLLKAAHIPWTYWDFSSDGFGLFQAKEGCHQVDKEAAEALLKD